MSEPVLDLMTLTELERRLGRDRIMKVIAAQLANGKDIGRRLATLEIAPDLAQIRALAHQLAGSSGSIGLMLLSSQAVALEIASVNTDAVALIGQVHALRSCLDISQAALRAQYPEIVDA